MRVEISRRRGRTLLLATSVLCVISVLSAGCSGKGTGDTVPSPPRELVDKSFHPPGGKPGAAAPTAADKVSAPAGQ